MNPEMTAGDRLPDRVARLSWLDAVANAVQPAASAALDGSGPVRTPVKNALHGSWLGHSLHPVITDIPVGAWSVAACADLIAMLGGEQAKRYDDTADVAVSIGIFGAVGAAVTGLADWSDTRDDARRLGMAHALLNSLALTGYVGSWFARRAGRRGLGRGLSLAAYAVAGSSAYLGGELSYSMQLGVRRTTEPHDAPTEFQAACAAAEIPAGGLERVELEGVPLLITRTEAGVCAVSAICTHRGAPLEQGTREGDTVRCPWHGSVFSLTNGNVIEGPAAAPLPRFEARERDGTIDVRRV